MTTFSSSSIRFAQQNQDLRDGIYGDVKGADIYSPHHPEPTHPDFGYYGIHGVEGLFTVMGPDCVSVSRTNTPNADVVVGVWKDKKIGTFRGIRKGAAPYSCKVFGKDGVQNVGDYEGYEPLLVEICKFFETGVSPVDEQETINIFAFMTAADMSRKEKGKSVALADAIKAAEDEKRLTVTITTTPTSQFIWSEGDIEKTLEDFHGLRELVEEKLEDYDVVRFVLDNRAGLPVDTILKALEELEDARLANYLY